MSYLPLMMSELFEFDSGHSYVHYRLKSERGMLYSRLRT